MRGILMVVVLVASWAGFEARGAEDAPAKPGDAVETPDESVESKGNEPPKETEQRKQVKQSWTFRGGTMLRVGPDGKVTAMQISGDLPEEVAKAIAQLKQQGKEQGAEQVKEHFEPNEQAVRPNIQGSITVVGPDGTVRKHTFGGADATSDDPFDVIGKVLEEQGLDPATIDGLRKMLPKTAAPKPATPAPASASDAVMKKLDLILERLEGLEKEVASLKAARDAKSRTE